MDREVNHPHVNYPPVNYMYMYRPVWIGPDVIACARSESMTDPQRAGWTIMRHAAVNASAAMAIFDDSDVESGGIRRSTVEDSNLEDAKMPRSE